MNGYAISGPSSIDASGQIAAGSFLANGNARISSDAWGARVLTTNTGNLGLGTAGLSNSIQIGATGNVGILKSATAPLDVEGQMKSTSVSTGALTLTGDAITQNTNPSTTNSVNCGDPSYRWAGTYTKDLDVTGSSPLGAKGASIASVRAFKANLGTRTAGVNSYTISYGTTYPYATKLIIQVTVTNDAAGVGDTFSYNLQSVGTSSCVLNVFRTDSNIAWGNPIKAHVVVMQLP
jgi:hypothetical protein